MMIRSGISHDIRYLSFKGKQVPTDTQALHMRVISPLTKMLNERNRTIESLYRGQKNLHFCRSSLHLAIGVLDKLILRGFTFEEEECELVAGSLLLLCTKFNEVYPVTVRKINLLMNEEHALDQFVDMEANILSTLDFNLFLEDALYEELAEFEARFQGQQALTCQEVIKTAILNPAYTFKHGTKSLMLALESFMYGLTLADRGNNNSFLQKEMVEIRGELTRLHSSSRRRLVSPCRA